MFAPSMKAPFSLLVSWSSYNDKQFDLANSDNPQMTYFFYYFRLILCSYMANRDMLKTETFQLVSKKPFQLDAESWTTRGQ